VWGDQSECEFCTGRGRDGEQRLSAVGRYTFRSHLAAHLPVGVRGGCGNHMIWRAWA
jgi:hypothetical protein